ncbi:MAG: hypothetical protein SFV51_00805 [Bryobacteraceae bacterium]|nr:hypothetical protein [Bryobacteraceae bacterium]
MSVAWGFRGFIGGGPLGAMIPGALVALALCMVLGRNATDSRRIAAFGAVAIGFGGEMTYGQTVGFIVAPQTYWWGLAGLSLKGAVWGLLGGAVLGAAFEAASEDDGRDRGPMAVALGLIVVGAWFGWTFINQPKLIYFSHPTDRPRPEIWAGLLIGALLFLLAKRRGAGWAVAAFIGGGIGFGAGGTLQAIGRSLPVDHRWFPWWKGMEFTFGFCFGAALAWAALRCVRPTPAGAASPSQAPVWMEMAGGALVGAALIGFETASPLRFSYTLAGVVMLLIVMRYPWLGWQVAITITCLAFFLDCAELVPGAPAVTVAITCAVGVSFWIARWNAAARPPRDYYLFLLLASLAVSLLKAVLHARPGPGLYVEQAMFLAGSGLLAWMWRRTHELSM